MHYTILTIPGINSSGASHWQTLWEQSLPDVRRVEQSEWDAPVRADWVATLQTAIADAAHPVVLVAHSLGCGLVAWWAATYPDLTGKIAGALLVAPPDVRQAGFPIEAVGFTPMPDQPLPFRTMVVASENDPWCSLSAVREMADNWHAEFHNIGAYGHINAGSNLGVWTQGQQFLSELIKQK